VTSKGAFSDSATVATGFDLSIRNWSSRVDFDASAERERSYDGSRRLGSRRWRGEHRGDDGPAC